MGCWLRRGASLMSLEAVRPGGSEYPNSKVLGPKIHTLNGFLDPETLLFGYRFSPEPG